MNYNKAIASLFGDDPYKQEYGVRGLRERWPQINQNTTVEFIQQREFCIPHEVAFNPLATEDDAKPGIKARLFRALGELMDSKDLKARGMHKVPVRSAPMPQVDTIQLETYAVKFSGYEAETIYIRCGYYARNDTLYVHGDKDGKR